MLEERILTWVEYNYLINIDLYAKSGVFLLFGDDERNNCLTRVDFKVILPPRRILWGILIFSLLSGVYDTSG